LAKLQIKFNGLNGPQTSLPRACLDIVQSRKLTSTCIAGKLASTLNKLDALASTLDKLASTLNWAMLPRPRLHDTVYKTNSRASFNRRGYVKGALRAAFTFYLKCTSDDGPEG
jgi:hypothetical protein